LAVKKPIKWVALGGTLRYTLVNSDARLNDAEREALTRGLEATLGDDSDNSGPGSDGDSSWPGSGDD
jgi:hypothetical protein